MKIPTEALTKSEGQEPLSRDMADSMAEYLSVEEMERYRAHLPASWKHPLTPRPKAPRREPAPTASGELLEGLRDLADAIREMPAPIVNIQPPKIEVTVNPELRIPAVVETSRLLRNERGVLTGSVKEVEPKNH